MKIKLLEKLCCPFDKNDLKVEVIQKHKEEIHEGILTCSHCNRYFPIIYGIPIMTPDEYRERSLELPMLKKWGLEIGDDQMSFVLTQPKQTKELN